MGNHAHDNLRLRQKRRRLYDQRVATIAKRAEIAAGSNPSGRKQGATANKSKPAASN